MLVSDILPEYLHKNIFRAKYETIGTITQYLY